MNSREQVETIRKTMESEGAERPDIIRQQALACLDWPYVFGAWGEDCTPANRKRRASAEHPTIVSKCPALNGKGCSDCRWGIGVRMFDCRGFTRWLIQQVGLDITGQGATSQYNTDKNWVRKGPISEMPDCVCCVFRKKDNEMEHTGMHLGGGVVVDCSVNVRSVGMSGWTHYAIPVGLYKEGEIPEKKVRRTLRKGDKGDDVKDLQALLKKLGYDCGNADGIFGLKTKEAVMLFQRQHRLTYDGVVGAKTWAALDEATNSKPDQETDETLYTVTCYGMTWDQVKKIREVCPSADVLKEGATP